MLETIKSEKGEEKEGTQKAHLSEIRGQRLKAPFRKAAVEVALEPEW
jgi:hypothetical protein